MTMIRWEPFREFDILRREMNRLFYDMAAANREEANLTAANRADWLPAIELQDNGNNLVIRAEIPGVNAQDLDVQVTKEAVSIAGEHRYEKRSEEHGNVRSEFRYGRFQRVIPLPAKVQNEQVQADLKDGILTLTLPKLEEERNRVVKVNLGRTQPEAIGG